MIDRKFQRPLHLFSWIACGAMTVKLVLFTEFNKRHPDQPHVFTGIQKYADEKLDEFFGVQKIVQKAEEKDDGASKTT
ncbi:hypothetical protein Poli38472_003022 [Pythium oligandrum]|uniref:Uncharacterized protein n=1 Tax=Pythium oligandrum TaxID=41045 RepID=A0A8K1C5V9_PYTOL|nr:hypothetical protein Poli38472_003022 [Pythium oligandrum]|eukprot:TMW57097.1 hypothetical protein Poli38472_003022 [Pythium oligandrum]